MPTYRAFGAIIQSTVNIPALEGVRLASPPPDVSVAMAVSVADAPLPADDDESAWHETVPDDAGQVLRVTRDRAGAFRFVYTDGTQFRIAPDQRSVQMYWPADLTLEDAVEYLLGPVVAFVLRQRGVVCLHAAAIAAGDGCFAVLAPAGHGKSTTAAACARRGWPVLTDDVLVLREQNGEALVCPAYPRVRLWPEAAEALFGSADALPRITPENDTWHKRYLSLDIPGYRYAADPLPLRSIYTHERQACPTPTFETLTTADALVTLIGNVYSLSRPRPEQRAREFELLERIARAVPMKRYRGRYGIKHIDEHCRALHDDCVGARSAVPAAAD
jgi:hypothetical protein